MPPRLALLLSCLLCLAVPAAAKGKKGVAKKKEPPKKESKYISVSPEAGKHVYRFDAHGRPVATDGAGDTGKDGEEGAEPAKGRKQQPGKKPGKKPGKRAVKKESKYISAAADAGRSVYRFDEHGRPVHGQEGEKEEEAKGKKDPKPR